MANNILEGFGRSFKSREVKEYLIKRDTARGHYSTYHPIRNSQLECYNATIHYERQLDWR